MKTEVSVDDEISLMDIYDFLVDGWKIILSITLIGTGIGVVTSLYLPDQFEAKGVIQSARIANMHSTNSTNGTKSIDVEPIAVLAEKMKSPTYYDSKMLAACVGEGAAGNLEAFAKALNATVTGKSNFVSVVYRAESRDKALRCLEQVLAVVVENQKDLVEAKLTSVMSSLDNKKKVADELRKAVKELELDRRVELKELEYSASALFIVGLESTVQKLLAVENEIYILDSMLKPQNTQEAKFLTPIFVSKQRVSPRRSQIVMRSAISSLFFGVLMLLSRRAFASVKKQRGERLKSASITP